MQGRKPGGGVQHIVNNIPDDALAPPVGKPSPVKLLTHWDQNKMGTILHMHLLDSEFLLQIHISLKFVPQLLTDNKSTLVLVTSGKT